MIQRGRRYAADGQPEPQSRDLEIIRALYRYRYLSTSLIARTWWRDCHPTRAQVRLRRMFDAGWIDRMRPRLARGSHEWIYRLAKPGFLLGQTYRCGNDTYIPRDAKWRTDEVADLDYVWHDLEVNEWMLSYADLLGDRLDDWLGPSEARLEIGTTFSPRARRHVPLTADQVLPRGVYARDLQLGRELRPLFPDASAVIAASDEYPQFELLVEYDRTARPAKNIEKLRRYDSLLTVGWRAVERFSGPDFEPPGRIALHPRLLVVFVCQPGTVESFMAVADGAITGTAGLLARPETTRYPGREAILFCDVEDMRSGSPRAWLLPELPAARRGQGRLELREVELPLPARTAADRLTCVAAVDGAY